MKQIFPSANEKRELQEQARADMELQLQMKEEMKKQALIDELEHAVPICCSAGHCQSPSARSALRHKLCALCRTAAALL